MEKMLADLHVHSFFSDGSMSPEEIVEAAVLNGVGMLAVADHDIIEENNLIRELCKDKSIHHIPAVEVDALDGETNNHIDILAYGFDSRNLLFADFIRHTRFLLDEISVKLIEKMRLDYPEISFDDYMAYSYNKRLGGWKALHYFMEKGITSSLKNGIMLYPKYGVLYEESGFSTVAAVAYRIKLAGGYSVLAHPGEVLDTSDIDMFKRELKRIISFGINGIECYYPSHSEAVTQACLDICNEYDLLITAGSDCHGVFGKTRVGEMGIRIDQLKLKNLV